MIKDLVTEKNHFCVTTVRNDFSFQYPVLKMLIPLYKWLTWLTWLTWLSWLNQMKKTKKKKKKKT